MSAQTIELVCVGLRHHTSRFASVCVGLRHHISRFASVCVGLRQFALVCASLRVLGGPRSLCFIISAGPVEICALKFRPSLTALEMAEFHLTKKKVNE